MGNSLCLHAKGTEIRKLFLDTGDLSVKFKQFKDSYTELGFNVVQSPSQSKSRSERTSESISKSVSNNAQYIASSSLVLDRVFVLRFMAKV